MPDCILIRLPIRVFFRSGDMHGASKIQILNTAGKVLQEAANVGALGMDVRRLPSGFFIVKIFKKDGSTFQYNLMKN